jgi:hypothetical protein
MADNKDVAIIKPLLVKGLVKGGDDKQAVCNKVKEFRIKKDDNGLKNYLETLELERTELQENGQMIKGLSDLTKLVLSISERLAVLEKNNKATKGGSK